MRTIRLYPLPITLVRFPPALIYASFPTSLLPLSPPHFSLFLTLILFQFAHSDNTLSRRIRYSRFLTNIHRAGIIILLETRVQLSYKRTTSAGKYVLRLSRSRFARVHPGRASQNQNTARSGWTVRREIPSFPQHAAVKLGRGDLRRNRDASARQIQ